MRELERLAQRPEFGTATKSAQAEMIAWCLCRQSGNAGGVSLQELNEAFEKLHLVRPKSTRIRDHFRRSKNIRSVSQGRFAPGRAFSIKMDALLPSEPVASQESDEAPSLAGIEYHGVAGSTADCLEAVERILHYRGDLAQALILTHLKDHTADHCLLLTTSIGDQIAIKSGFGSGYSGQGSRGFSSVLGLLRWHGVELEEIEVGADVIERVDLSALTGDDLDALDNGRRVRPMRLWEYILERDFPLPGGRNPWRDRLVVMPLALIDDRLVDLARSFWDNPDVALFQGHRRLETIVRSRIGWDEDETAPNPSKMFGAAFNLDNARLTWPGVSRGERQGRAQLFTGTAMAHRNPRAHRERDDQSDNHLAEFLVLNHLFRLEAEAQLVE